MSWKSEQSSEDIFKKRLLVTFLLFVFVFATFIGRVIDLSVFNRGKLLAEFAPQVVPSYDILRAERGEILDRSGVKLATNELTFELDINPNIIDSANLSKIRSILKRDLKFSNEELNKLLSAKSYVLVSTSVSKDTKEKIDALNLKDGVVFTKTYKRVYPYGEIISPLIGIVGAEGTGLTGLELSLDDYLKGRNGRSFRTYNFAEPDVLGAPTYVLNPVKGNNITLTIDINIQAKVYELVKKYVEEFHAKNGFAIVTDPESNEVLAMVTYPSFDPTNFNKIMQNLPTTFNYEPGSIMKPIVALAALEEGKLKIDDNFYCSGSIKVKDTVISCWKKHGEEHGLSDILVNSCDVAFAQIALRLQKDSLLKYFKLFGFGDKTQIELYGEERGIVPSPKNIGDVEVANMGFGQGVAVTQIQMVSALNAIVNGGKLYTPRLVKEIKSPDGNVVYSSEPILRRTIGSKTNLGLIKSAMVEVVEIGAPKAKIEGYKVMGKTGTAQKPNPGGGYSHTKLIYSFFGAIPYPDPRVSVIVSINETSIPQYSTTVSAPLFSEIGTFLVKYLRIEK
ncbi:peptidoglycan D,D-transpeptidase FtsI family protein [Caldisericum exile]|uniref:Peptidoglycan synthetase FtsI n=1 Tax=Caldisericum exile (strain DSM 21853 / NBRC 104410 / AZM16c01) TaxID=511051 RepID=A0A7U6GF95_CALEA|nr:penicillin-binding protein 2 [Caldisericum exile]BAL81313.1 putative peptidoglycan synthetase FtsI [Caldisericum exile AZM16c01]